MVRAYRHVDERDRFVWPLARPRRAFLCVLGGVLLVASLVTFLLSGERTHLTCRREGSSASCRAEVTSRLTTRITNLEIARFGAIRIERAPLRGLRLVVSSVDGGSAASSFGRNGDDIALAAHALVEFMDRPARKAVHVGFGDDDGWFAALAFASLGAFVLVLAQRTRVLMFDRSRAEGTLRTRALGMTIRAESFPLSDVVRATVDQSDLASPFHLVLVRIAACDVPLDFGEASPTVDQRRAAAAISEWLHHDAC